MFYRDDWWRCVDALIQRDAHQPAEERIAIKLEAYPAGPDDNLGEQASNIEPFLLDRLVWPLSASRQCLRGEPRDMFAVYCSTKPLRQLIAVAEDL